MTSSTAQWNEWRVPSTQQPVDARTVSEIVIQATWDSEGHYRWVELQVGGQCAVLDVRQLWELYQALRQAAGLDFSEKWRPPTSCRGAAL